MTELNKEVLPTNDSNNVNPSYIYENWNKNDFLELYSLLKSSSENEIIHLFLEGYTELFKHKEQFIALGYTDFTFKYYVHSILKFYGKNFQKIAELTSVFEKLLRNSNQELRVKDVINACSKDNQFLLFLVDVEKNNPVLIKSGMKALVNYLAIRFNSKFQNVGSHYIPLEMVEVALKRFLTNVQESTFHTLNLDYGWNSFEEWSSLFDSGKKQFYYDESKKFDTIRLVDFLHMVMKTKPYARNKDAVSLIVNAKEDFASFMDRTIANSELFINIEKTEEYKTVVKAFQSFNSEANQKGK